MVACSPVANLESIPPLILAALLPARDAPSNPPRVHHHHQRRLGAAVAGLRWIVLRKLIDHLLLLRDQPTLLVLMRQDRMQLLGDIGSDRRRRHVAHELQGQLSRATADLEYLGAPCPDFGEDPPPRRGGWEDDIAYMRAKGSELRRRIKIASEAVTEACRNRPATPPRAPAAKRPRTDTARCIHGYCGAKRKFRMASELDRLGMYLHQCPPCDLAPRGRWTVYCIDCFERCQETHTPGQFYVCPFRHSECIAAHTEHAAPFTIGIEAKDTFFLEGKNAKAEVLDVDEMFP